jgi:hypothetical protein
LRSGLGSGFGNSFQRFLELTHLRHDRHGRLHAALAALFVVGLPGSRRDQATNDNVLLEPAQIVLGTLDGGLGEYPRGLLERRR